MGDPQGVGKKIPKLRNALRGRGFSDSPQHEAPDESEEPDEPGESDEPRDEEPAEVKPPDFQREAARAMGQSDPDDVLLTTEGAWWETPAGSSDDDTP